MQRSYPSVHDEMYDEPRTPQEIAAFMSAMAKNMHERMKVVENRMDDFQRRSLPAKTFARVNMLEDDFCTQRKRLNKLEALALKLRENITAEKAKKRGQKC